MGKTRTQAIIDRQERKVRQHASSRYYKLDCPTAFVLRTVMWGTRKVYACTATATIADRKAKDPRLMMAMRLWNSQGEVVLTWHL